MTFLNFRQKKKKTQPPLKQADKGFLAFANTSEVIRAEKILRAQGFEIRVMGPPPEIRSGCDLVIEFPLIEALKIKKILKDARVPPLNIVPVNGPLLKPVDLFHVKDYGRHLMVRAANMKLTVDKETLIIANVSGGGCPDVPFLAQELVGKPLGQAPNPLEIGHTLCGYALHLAFEEVKRRCWP